MNFLLQAWFLLAQALPFPGPNTAHVVSTPFVTGETLGTLRNNFSGCAGFQIQVSTSPITITDVGRWVVSGNSQTHTLQIRLASNNMLMVNASVNTSGAMAGAFTYTSVSPVTLSASTNYNFGSSETSGGDQFYDSNTTITHTSVAAVVATFATFSGGNCSSNMFAGGQTYGPLDFKYHL